MASHILRRSGGCFLWACLVCMELREVSTLTEIEKVLNSTPSDMEAVCSIILEDMIQARFRKMLQKQSLPG